MIHNHIIAQNAIIKVYQFAMSTRGDRKICYVLDAEQAAPNPGSYFGAPTDIRLFVPPQKGDKTTQQQTMMVDSMAMGKPEQKGRCNDGFFSTRSESRWQNAHRDLHHRQVLLANM